MQIFDPIEYDVATRRKKKFSHVKPRESLYRCSESKPEKSSRRSNLSDPESAYFNIGEEKEPDVWDEFSEEIEGREDGLSKSTSPLPNELAGKFEHSKVDHFRNGLWVISAILIFSYLDIPRVVMYDHRVKHSVLGAGVFCTAGFLSICAYHVIWMSWIKRIEESAWEKHFPLGVPIASVAIICSGILYTIAFWNIWFIFTPLLLFAFAMPIIIVISYF